MAVLAKIRIAVCAAGYVLLTSLAQGAYNGDFDYSTIPVEPTNRGSSCLGANCPTGIRYSAQSFDCNGAFYGAPRYLGNPDPVVNPLDLSTFKEQFFSNPEPGTSDLTGDGDVNFADFMAIRESFFSQTAGGSTSSSTVAPFDPMGPSGSINPEMIDYLMADLPAGNSEVKFFPDASAIGADTWPSQNFSNSYGSDADPSHGVVPFNFFGGPGSVTQEMLDYVGVDLAESFETRTAPQADQHTPEILARIRRWRQTGGCHSFE